jgi:hypothetical protein
MKASGHFQVCFSLILHFYIKFNILNLKVLIPSKAPHNFSFYYCIDFRIFPQLTHYTAFDSVQFRHFIQKS